MQSAIRSFAAHRAPDPCSWRVDGQPGSGEAAGVRGRTTGRRSCCRRENVAYTTGFVVPSQPLMRWRRAVCIVPAEGPPSVVVVDVETTTVRDHLPSIELFTYNEFLDDPMRALATALAKLGLGSATLGVEADLQGDAARLHGLPGATFAACDRAVAEPQDDRSATEIEQLGAERAGRCHDLRRPDLGRRPATAEMDLAGALTGDFRARRRQLQAADHHHRRAQRLPEHRSRPTVA